LIHASRLRILNLAPERRGAYVLYWMQAAPRRTDNPALDYAITRADELHLPLLCTFGLTARYPEANLRHYAFLAQGLAETARSLRELGIRLVVFTEEPDRAALCLALEAALLVTDRSTPRQPWSDWIVSWLVHWLNTTCGATTPAPGCSPA
jgi:deoxyribodipyrimidine photo-lyase